MMTRRLEGMGETRSHWHQTAHSKAKVDLGIRKETEPPVAMALLEFASRLCTTYRASRVLST